MSAITLPGRSRVLADLVPRSRARDAALVLGGTVFLTLAGYVAIPLPFTPVPLSLGTFAALLTGAALGPARGAASAGLYLFLGVVGLPVFAGGSSGWAFASFGYIIGFVLAAVVTGQLARRRTDRSVGGAIVLGAVGSLVIYACGVPWFMTAGGVGLSSALALGVVPFLAGDAIKAVAVALVLPGTWRLVDRAR